MVGKEKKVFLGVKKNFWLAYENLTNQPLPLGFHAEMSMKKVYCQPYKNNKHISAWYGKPPKGHFKYDQIKIHLGGEQEGCKCGGDIYITPDECADYIRAFSAALHHWLVKNTKKIIEAKSK